MQCPASFHDPLRSFQRWICFVPLAAGALGALGALACACPAQQNSTFIEEFNKGGLGLDGDADDDDDDDDDGSLAIHRFLSGPFSGRSEKEPKAETQLNMPAVFLSWAYRHANFIQFQQESLLIFWW